jgi:hypothetical protein
LGNDPLRHSKGIALPYERIPVNREVLLEGNYVARIGDPHVDVADLVPIVKRPKDAAD